MIDKGIDREIDWRLRVFESLSYPTVILLPDRTIIAVNSRYLEKVGVEEEEILGRSCREVNLKYYPDQKFPCIDKADCPLKRAVETRSGQSALLKFRDVYGEECWEERVLSPILGADGEVDYIIESIRDVTRVKHLEKMYSGVRELIDRVVQTSVSGIIAADRQGRIILMNKAAEDLFGYSGYGIDNVNIEDYYPPGVARDIMRMLRSEEIGEKGKLPITRVTIRRKDGTEIPAEMTAVIIYEDGREAATAGIFNDLREKLEVERQLKDAHAQLIQSEKLASLGRLAAGVAHEINNPLTGILMYASLMREKLEKDHPLEQNLSYIVEDTQRCQEIVRNLLAYSRQSNPSRQYFQLDEVLGESLRLVRDQKLFLHVKVVEDAPAAPVLVNADKNQLCQVVINLIINAVDAMDGNGTLTLRTLEDRQSRKAIRRSQRYRGRHPGGKHVEDFDPFFPPRRWAREPASG